MKENFNERRITNQVCEYWKEIKKDRTYPKKSDIDFEEIVELLPYCVIIKITPTNKEVKYEYDHLGDMVDKFYNEGVFAETFVQFVSPEIETFEEYLEEVYDSGEPIIEHSHTIDINQNSVKFRQCILPLSDNGKEINAVLCAINCKRYS